MLTILACCLLAATPADDPSNILIVLMDDVGRDKIGAYADHPNPAPTPALDALAAQGVLFRNAWAYPVCSPTRAALLTGRYGDRTGITTIISATDGVYTPLPPAETTLAAALPRHRSMALGKWHLKDTGDPLEAPLQAGFDLCSGYAGQARYFQWTRHENGMRRDESGYYPSTLTRRAIELLEASQGTNEPFFAYHCPILAHSPFHVPPSYLHSQGSPSFPAQQHIAMVEALDRHLGLLLAAVDLNETYVFVIGDNGSPNGTITAPWPMGHGKRTPYEGGVRVPFLVAGPGVAAGAECDALIHVTDVFATVQQLVGQTTPASIAQDSISFAAQLTQPQSAGGRDHLYIRQAPFPGATGQVPEFRALRTIRYKLIQFSNPAREELYDLSVDPHETQDLLVLAPGSATTSIRDRLAAAFPTFP
ncbi:Arylsulfatase [Planctomycetes bacterium Poly30]|uniref:Arylsulfatase n=1 Tax=Saltatorellus ferox TaxID=2528018 RepID=A0A518EVP1_9BACT|nr:Arylsulfatase [Planctomycetes bacterium Poly30]